jgi:Asp-tRNA(Asn)/Glu-tRNA(Gln) amidotransferase A subunit family amidase
VNAPVVGSPRMRSYLAHASQFKSGTENPRDFLEACLANLNTWEPKVGAFVNLNIEGARQAADRATARWRAGAQLSPIDGMPVGIKDIIESADMPTEMGSPLFAGWRSQKDAASVAALRQAGAVILGKTVTTEFAASEPRATRNPWNLEHTPGGSSSGSAAAVAAGMISGGLGTQVIGSTIRPASFCGCVGFKPTVGALNREGSHDYQSQSCTGILAATLPDAWQVAHEIAQRVGGDAGTPGLMGPERAPAPVKPRRLAFLETSGWAVASEAAKTSMQDALRRLSEAGVEIRTSADDADVSAIETELADAFTLSNRINSFETRWFIDGCAERDASLLSQSMRDRLEQARGMTLADYRGWLKQRTSVRALYAELADTCDACVTLAAPGPAPQGLQTTGNPQFAVPASLLGIPALSLPLFMLDGMPLGLQALGYANGDANIFATGAWLMGQLGGETG